MAVEGIKRGIESEIRPRLDNPEVLDALRRGNIDDVLKALPAGVTRQDIEEYLKYRWSVLDHGLLQNVQIKADAASVPAITKEDLLPFAPEHQFTTEDRALLQQGLGMGKAAAITTSASGGNGAGVLGKGKATGGASGGVPAEQLTGMVESHLKEFDEFMNQIQNKIFEVQLSQQLEAKHQELKQELARIIAMMREGTLDPEYVLIALAKVQISERGLLFTQYGQRMMHANEEQSRIAKEIGLMGPEQFGGMEVKRHEIAKETMEIGQFASMLQKISQDIESIFAFAKGASEEIIKTKMELARKAEVRAG